MQQAFTVYTVFNKRFYKVVFCCPLQTAVPQEVYLLGLILNFNGKSLKNEAIFFRCAIQLSLKTMQEHVSEHCG